MEDEAIDELEVIYQEKYLRNCDKPIPLHGLTHAMAKLAIARMRFKVHHPKRQAAFNSGKVYMTPEESAMLSDSAVTLLEMVDLGIRSDFSSHLFTHMTSKFQIDAYIYVISELRQRYSGDRVDLAWTLVRNLYDEHPELIVDVENTFSGALGSLILEASEQYMLQHCCGAEGFDVTPEFFRSLLSKRQREVLAGIQMPFVTESRDTTGLVSMNNDDIDWEFRNDFLRL